jgi:hypothetical protein
VSVSSTFLYLAIVAVWAVVLVPMWLRRDTEATTLSRILHRRGAADAPVDSTLEEPEELHDEVSEDEIPTEVRPRRNSRAAVIARRRRRTSGLLALVLLSAVAATTGLGPWWVVLPPVALLMGHLSLLRVAVGMDTLRRQEIQQARRATRERLRAEAEARLAAQEEAAQAEIIDLADRARAHDVFDQYADDDTRNLRAVGD